jgi:triosephosphate isomerase (TIM)
MSLRKLIAANWKMNKTISEASAFALEFRDLLPTLPDCDLAIFPSFFCMRPVADVLSATRVAIGAQDVYWEASGAFTGEVSTAMVNDAGGSCVLVGHSERRHVIGEDDLVVARKLTAALNAGLLPVLCVGETLAERDAGRENEVVVSQLETSIDDRPSEDIGGVVLAYEPVWAIGTGRTATAADAARMHATIRAWLRDRHSPALAERVRILYGGSVKPDNAAELLAAHGVDGLLVGGASLEAGTFAAIVRGVA